MIPRTRIKGVTIIELILVISLTIILAGVTTPALVGFLTRHYLKTSAMTLLSALKTAQANSLSGKSHSAWGVYTGNQEIIMFKGSSYTPPGTSLDHHYALPQAITVSTNTVVFNTLNGNPTSIQTITLTTETNQTKSVTINSVGTFILQ